MQIEMRFGKQFCLRKVYLFDIFPCKFFTGLQNRGRQDNILPPTPETHGSTSRVPLPTLSKQETVRNENQVVFNAATRDENSCDPGAERSMTVHFQSFRF